MIKRSSEERLRTSSDHCRSSKVALQKFRPHYSHHMEERQGNTRPDDDIVGAALDEAKVDKVDILDESEAVKDAKEERIGDLVEKDSEPDGGEGERAGGESCHQRHNVDNEANLIHEDIKLC